MGICNSPFQEKWREAKSEWLAALEVKGVAVGSELPRVTSLASLAKAGGAGAAAVDASSPARVKSSASGGDSSPARPSSVRPSRRPMSATRVTPSWSPARGGGVAIVEKESPPEVAAAAQESSKSEDRVDLLPKRKLSHPQAIRFGVRQASRAGMPPFSPMRSDDGRDL